MSENQLIPIRHKLPTVHRNNPDNKISAIVKYERIDANHYSFSYDLNDSIKFRMGEADQATERTDFVDAEYSDNVTESDKLYYAVAAASGLLTGTLSVFHFSEEQIKSINADWRTVVITAAKLTGYKKSDYKGASKYLIAHAVRTIAKDGKAKETFSVLAEHPSVTGLIFSLLTQYTGKSVVLSDKGTISDRKLPNYYVIGDTNAEKIVCAVLYWLFCLTADEVGSKRRILEDIRIPKEIQKIIKEFINSPIMKNIPADYAGAEKTFSAWIKKTIKGAELFAEQPHDEKTPDPMLEIMGAALDLAEDSFPVLINEGVVCAMHIFLKVCSEVKARNITTLEGLAEIPTADVLPTDSRLFSRMHLIASASFVCANVAGAAYKAVKGMKANGRNFGKTFLAELNLVGVGCFLFAIAKDAKYWGDDIRVIWQRNENKKTADADDSAYEFAEEKAFQPLFLDPIQTRILYNLENMLVLYDIEHTQKPELAARKQEWLDAWKDVMLNGLGLAPELKAVYFVDSKEVERLYDTFYLLAKNERNLRWFYLFTLEMALFKPYFALGCPKKDKLFKDLKQESDYVKEQFVRRQTIVSQAEVDAFVKTYSKYEGYVSGRTQGKIIGAGVAAAAAVATGGAALTFAPGIAAAIAGEAVVGLHGAALTSASLAFVGGGSLTAGGLGMAGGTAIITGGGALLGLAGSGTASAATVLLQTPSNYWVCQSAKLLTYSKCVLFDILKDKDAVSSILSQTESKIKETKNGLAIIKAEKNDLSKDLIKKTEEYLKYLEKNHAELQKIVKN